MGLCIVLLSLLRPLIRHCVSPRLYSGSQKLIRALKHNMWKLFVQNSNNIIFTDILVGQNLSNPECFVIWGHFIVYINILDYFEPFGPIWALGDFGQIQRCKNLGSRVTFWFVRFFQTISHFPTNDVLFSLADKYIFQNIYTLPEHIWYYIKTLWWQQKQSRASPLL